MNLDFRNVNTLWSSIIVQTFTKLGVKNAVISPGSRSTPLTIAFAQNSLINTIPILDERSASFFALGLAKKTNLPTVLICTSGTAGANFYPAIIEAKYSHIPLIILTADRPPELRNCHAGQTINQINLYANYPQWQTELSLPSNDLELLFYLRQNIIYAWEKSFYPQGGVVHINIPFREPLAPINELNISEEKQQFIEEQLLTNFPLKKESLTDVKCEINNYLNGWKNEEKGIIIAGVDSYVNSLDYALKISQLSKFLNFPVLTEALSPLRNHNYFNSNLIINYDIILRNQDWADKLIPKIVILIGEYPTSKELRNWLNKHKIKTYIITDNDDNLDALHTNSVHLRWNIEKIEIDDHDLSKNLHKNLSKKKEINYLDDWLKREEIVSQFINTNMNENEELFEGKVAWLLSKLLPEKTPIFLANSMSVRYAEFFWQKNSQQTQIYFSRGANGIDGTLSTALGIAYQNKSTVLLTGDLAILHDTNGFLINQFFEGSLTIILINNNGGGIFEMLPIAEQENLLEKYFTTPQFIDFEKLTKTYNVNYKLINNWQQLTDLLTNLPQQGINLWEIKTDRKKDAIYLKNILNNFNSR